MSADDDAVEGSLVAFTRVLDLALRIGFEWRNQDGINAELLDELGEAVHLCAGAVMREPTRVPLTPAERRELNDQLAAAVARWKGSRS